MPITSLGGPSPVDDNLAEPRPRDDVGQSLMVLKVRLDAVRRQTPDAPTARLLQDAVGQVEHIARQVRSLSPNPPASGPAEDGLTPRLRQILRLVAEGKSTKQIARILNTSPKTVENHRGRLTRRLGIRDVAGLTRYALRHGLIDDGA